MATAPETPDSAADSAADSGAHPPQDGTPGSRPDAAGSPPRTPPDDPLVALQIGAVSFADEGVAPLLDRLRERGAVNALFLASPTWTRGTGGRQLPGHPLPDHGVQEYDREWVGGNYATVHPEYYRGTLLGAAGAAPEHPGWDLFDAVLPAARERGMKSFAWMEESGYAAELRTYPGFLSCLESDVWGRPAPRPCFNNPDYRAWHLAMVEDYAKSYELDGIAWCSERPGPLNLLVEAPVTPDSVTCFCRHCARIGADRGIDVARARQGYREALAWNQRLADGDRPADGAFVTFWRLLMRYPELLAWQQLWTDSQHQLYRDIYGTAKACRADLLVGWHVYHNLSFSPFYRASQDYAEMSGFSDFLKVVTYHNCAGPRFTNWIRNIGRALFADASGAEVYPLVQRLLGIDEAPLEELAATGFSAEYVRRETARAVAGLGGRTAVWPGIDIDIPVGPGKEPPTDLNPGNSTGLRGSGADRGELARTTREGVRDGVLAAFAGGAGGVVLSRKYSEMRLDNLAGAGDAMRQLAEAGR
ncbi:hypothetical protein [Streptomyces sp. TS71-3]|uniref:hypothetical protein n=1 Tax=Streptomyces sp. TS71-3 TaxID=2733862 RepID=UPI001B00162F|nr:hypothetical protein [Streptomyces sp. TS71-3]GHJ36724.1 hypothetical protein Sm713_23330 [Streptomyces sp. TS71-3]